jgi:hypothetical protein
LVGLLADFKSATGIELELHPSYPPGRRRADNLYVDYKLHERGAPVDRILNLLVCETEYVRDSDGRWRFYPEIAERIRLEILKFWSGERNDRTCIRYIPSIK